MMPLLRELHPLSYDGPPPALFILYGQQNLLAARRILESWEDRERPRLVIWLGGNNIPVGLDAQVLHLHVGGAFVYLHSLWSLRIALQQTRALWSADGDLYLPHPIQGV